MVHQDWRAFDVARSFSSSSSDESSRRPSSSDSSLDSVSIGSPPLYLRKCLDVIKEGSSSALENVKQQFVEIFTQAWTIQGPKVEMLFFSHVNSVTNMLAFTEDKL